MFLKIYLNTASAFLVNRFIGQKQSNHNSILLRTEHPGMELPYRYLFKNFMMIYNIISDILASTYTVTVGETINKILGVGFFTSLVAGVVGPIAILTYIKLCQYSICSYRIANTIEIVILLLFILLISRYKSKKQQLNNEYITNKKIFIIVTSYILGYIFILPMIGGYFNLVFNSRIIFMIMAESLCLSLLTYGMYVRDLNIRCFQSMIAIHIATISNITVYCAQIITLIYFRQYFIPYLLNIGIRIISVILQNVVLYYHTRTLNITIKPSIDKELIYRIWNQRVRNNLSIISFNSIMEFNIIDILYTIYRFTTYIPTENYLNADILIRNYIFVIRTFTLSLNQTVRNLMKVYTIDYIMNTFTSMSLPMYLLILLMIKYGFFRYVCIAPIGLSIEIEKVIFLLLSIDFVAALWNSLFRLILVQQNYRFKHYIPFASIIISTIISVGLNSWTRVVPIPYFSLAISYILNSYVYFAICYLIIARAPEYTEYRPNRRMKYSLLLTIMSIILFLINSKTKII